MKTLLKKLTTAALSLAALLITGSAWAATDELGLTPKHWYKFNDDLSSSGEAALTRMSGSEYEDALDGKALKGTGGSSYGENCDFGGNDFTLFCVAKAFLRSDNNAGILFSSGHNSGCAKGFALTIKGSSTIAVRRFGDNDGWSQADIITTTVPTACTAYHAYAIVYTESDNTIKLYVDGLLCGTDRSTPFQDYDQKKYQLNRLYGGTGYGMEDGDGMFCDDLRVYQRALVETQVQVITSTFIPTPVAVWSGDLADNSTKEDIKIVLNGNQAENGVVTITQATGIQVQNNKFNDQKITVLFKYSNLDTTVTADRSLITCGGGNNSLTANIDIFGFYAAGGSTAKGVVSGGAWGSSDAESYSKGSFESSGTIALAYNYNDTTKAYMNGQLVYDASTKLQSSSVYTHCIGIGGNYSTTGSGKLAAATGMKIEAIAVFAKCLSAGQIAAYEFPDSPTPSIPAVILNDARLWLDASDEKTFTIENDVVTAWNDKSSSHNNATGYTSTKGTREQVNGRWVYQMGNVGSGIDMSFTKIEDIRTVFWVMDIKQDQKAFFLGCDDGFNFHRGPDGKYAGQTDQPFYNAKKIYCDGAVKQKTDIAPTGMHLYATILDRNASANCLSQDRSESGRNGGRALSELIIFNRELTNAEMQEVSKYLNNKWHPTRMFSDPLATDDATVLAGTYGNIEVPGAGYKATAYSSATSITPTTGSLDGLIGNPNWTYLLTSTVSGWFKIDALLTGADATIYGYTRDGKTCSMRVAVTPEGKLKIGKGNGANVEEWDSGNRSGFVTTEVDVPIKQWFYLTVAGQRDPEQNAGDSKMTLAVFINGVQRFTKEKCFLNDGDNGSSNTFVIGAGVSAAGLYGDTTAVIDAAKIKSWATDATLVEAAIPKVQPFNLATAYEGDWTGAEWKDSSIPDAKDVGEGDWNSKVDASITLESGTTTTLGIDRNLELAHLTIENAGMLAINNTSENTITVDAIDDSASTGATTIGFEVGAATITAGANTTLGSTGTGTLTIGESKKATVPAWDNTKVSGAGTLYINAATPETAVSWNKAENFSGVMRLDQGTWEVTAGSNAAGYPRNSAVEVGPNGTLYITTGTDATGYNGNLSKSLTIDGGIVKFGKRDTFSRSLILKNGGKLLMTADNTDSSRALDLYSGASITVQGTTPAIIGGLTDGSTSASGIIAIRRSNLTVTVEDDATLKCYSQWGTAAGNGNDFIKAGNGIWEQYRAANNTLNFVIQAGTLKLVNAGRVTNGGMTINQGATLELNATEAQTVANVLSGNGAVVKTGTSTTTLTGANTYTGGTTINAGKLIVNGNFNGNYVINTDGVAEFTVDTTVADYKKPTITTLDGTLYLKVNATSAAARSGEVFSIGTLPTGVDLSKATITLIDKESGEAIPTDVTIDSSTGEVTVKLHTDDFTLTPTASGDFTWAKENGSSFDDNKTWVDFGSVSFKTTDNTTSVAVPALINALNIGLGGTYTFSGSPIVASKLSTIEGAAANFANDVVATDVTIDDGAVAFASLAANEVAIENATLDAKVLGPSMKYVRLKITATQTEGQQPAVGEFRLYRGSATTGFTKVDWPVGTKISDGDATVTKEATGYPAAVGTSNENQPGCLIDGYYGNSTEGTPYSQPNNARTRNLNKWWLDGKSGPWVVTIEFPYPVATFSGCNFCLADHAPRNPTAWTIEVSSDGENWTEVSRVSGATWTEQRVWNVAANKPDGVDAEDWPAFMNAVTPTAVSVGNNTTIIADGNWTAALNVTGNLTLKGVTGKNLTLDSVSTSSFGTDASLTLDLNDYRVVNANKQYIIAGPTAGWPDVQHIDIVPEGSFTVDMDSEGYYVIAQSGTHWIGGENGVGTWDLGTTRMWGETADSDKSLVWLNGVPANFPRNGTVTVDEGVSATAINLTGENTAVTLSGALSTLNGTPVNFNGVGEVLTLNTGSAFTLGAITASVNSAPTIETTGAGVVTLAANNQFAGGTLKVGSEATFNMTGAVSIGSLVGTGSLTGSGTLTIATEIDGTVTLADGIALVLADGAKLDLTNASSGYSKTLTANGALTVDVTGRTFNEDEMIVSWTAKPTGEVTVSGFAVSGMTYQITAAGIKVLDPNKIGDHVWTPTGESGTWSDTGFNGDNNYRDVSASAKFVDGTGIASTAVTIDGTRTVDALVIDNTDTTYTLDGGVVVATTFEKKGAGTATMKVTNGTNLGAATISGGTLVIGTDANNNTYKFNANTVTVKSGATLDVRSRDSVNNVPTWVVEEGGKLTTRGFNALQTVTLTGGTIESVAGYGDTWRSWCLTGSITANGNVTSYITTGANPGSNYGFQLATGIFNVEGTSVLEVSTPLQNEPGDRGELKNQVRKTGTGTMIIKTTPAYTGITDIQGGTYILDCAIASNSGQYQVASGALLDVGTNRGLTIAGAGDIKATITASEMASGAFPLFTKAADANISSITLVDEDGESFTPSSADFDENGNYVVFAKAAAKIGTTLYLTLNEAIEAAGENDEILVLSTIADATVTIPEGKNVVIGDLSGVRTFSGQFTKKGLGTLTAKGWFATDAVVSVVEGTLVVSDSPSMTAYYRPTFVESGAVIEFNTTRDLNGATFIVYGPITGTGTVRKTGSRDLSFTYASQPSDGEVVLTDFNGLVDVAEGCLLGDGQIGLTINKGLNVAADAVVYSSYVLASPSAVITGSGTIDSVLGMSSGAMIKLADNQKLKITSIVAETTPKLDLTELTTFMMGQQLVKWNGIKADSVEVVWPTTSAQPLTIDSDGWLAIDVAKPQDIIEIPTDPTQPDGPKTKVVVDESFITAIPGEETDTIVDRLMKKPTDGVFSYLEGYILGLTAEETTAAPKPYIKAASSQIVEEGGEKKLKSTFNFFLTGKEGQVAPRTGVGKTVKYAVLTADSPTATNWTKPDGAESATGAVTVDLPSPAAGESEVRYFKPLFIFE